jgi:hypothetical protein
VRICRFQRSENPEMGFYHDHSIVPVQDALDVHNQNTDRKISLPHDDVLALMPHGAYAAEASALENVGRGRG